MSRQTRHLRRLRNQVPEPLFGKTLVPLLLSKSAWLAPVAMAICCALVTGCSHTAPSPELQASALHLVVAPVQRGNISEFLTLTGTVLPQPDHSINVTPAIQGRIQKIFVVPGQVVRKGDLIARLDATQLYDKVKQTQAQVDQYEAIEDQAEIALKLAHENERRMARLYASDIGAKKDLEAAQATVASDKEKLNAAHSNYKQLLAALAAVQVQLSYSDVRSPISGMVANRFLDETDQAGPTTPIVQVVDLSTVFVNALLPPSLPNIVRPGLPADVFTPATPGVTLPAVVAMVSPVADTASQYIPVQVKCRNPAYMLKQGQPVSVSIVEKTDVNAMVVPATALVANPKNPDGKMIYVYEAAGKSVHRVPVTVGIKHLQLVEILSGVFPGELIVTGGAYGIPDGTKVEAQIAKVYPDTRTAIASD